MSRSILLIVASTLLGACHRATMPSGVSSPASQVHVATNVRAVRPPGVTDALITEGDSIFHAGSCHRCHGETAGGGANGPSLTGGSWLHIDGSYDAVVRIVTTGVPQDSIVDKSHQFNMRPRGGMQPLLTDNQVRAVAAYVWSLSHK